MGRPTLQAEIRDLIRRMARENPPWGAPRIGSELRLLGYSVADSTVAKYLPRDGKPPSQSWRTFLANHVGDIAAIDFFTVPTATFRILYCCLVLRHARRWGVHFNVTAHPTAAWTAQQVVEGFPYDQASRFLLHDRDSIYGEAFRRRLKGMGIQSAYLRYYHEARPHLSLDRNAPMPRVVEPPSRGTVVALSYLGGLHHRYARAA